MRDKVHAKKANDEMENEPAMTLMPAAPDDDLRPKAGHVVIWDVEPEHTLAVYWVRTQGRGSATQLFEGPDGWVRASAAAEKRAGPDGIIWKRHKDGHFEKLTKS